MAKKGAQLQLEINNDEEWEKLLLKDGLILVDVYTEWCGPCSGMSANLKKIKLEYGGDLLILAMAKSDYITDLERFRHKSEPTWLFISKGKKVNLLFGANAPEIMRIITDEINKERHAVETGHDRPERTDITEMHPIEIARYEEVQRQLKLAKEREEAKKIKDFRERKIAECKNIINNLSMGTILIFPCAKDRYTEILVDTLKEASVMVAAFEKVKINLDMIEDMFYFCEEKLSQKTIEDILNGRIAFALLIKRNGDLPGDIDEIVLQIVYGNSRKPPGSENSPCDQLTVKLNYIDDEGIEKENNLVGIWAPPNKLTKALVFKHLFPNLSAPFKFPESDPPPYYVAVAYDAFKTREVMELSDLYPGHVLMYGFFSSDKPTEATLISKTVEEFDERTTPVTYEEKIVIKLAKTTDECLNAFIELNPTYMSPDVEQGEVDCKFFFPDGYNVTKEVIHEVKKKFKKRGKAKAAAVNQEEVASTATSDLVKEQEELDHEDLEDVISDDEKNECEILTEENVEEEGESAAGSAREADKATSPISECKTEE